MEKDYNDNLHENAAHFLYGFARQMRKNQTKAEALLQKDYKEC
ncbi:MAG: hypothetical protein QM731_25595 [Chitinophagaceae bacterium]